MTNPYQPKWRADRSQPRSPTTNDPTPVTWIVTIGFICIIVCLLYPLFQRFLGAGE